MSVDGDVQGCIEKPKSGTRVEIRSVSQGKVGGELSGKHFESRSGPEEVEVECSLRQKRVRPQEGPQNVQNQAGNLKIAVGAGAFKTPEARYERV